MTLQQALTNIDKKYGPEALRRYSDMPTMNIDVIPSGNLGLDLALGVRGYPRGRVVEIYGPESSGKTTLTLHAIAEAQKLVKNGFDEFECAFIDAEHALDPVYASAIGVDMQSLFISQPDNGEMALEIVDELVDSGSFGLIVVDSVAALVPRAEIAGDMGDSHVGLQARLMSQALRKLVGKANKTNTTIFFINQLREKIGVMFGSPETTPGGRALKFYSSVRLDIRRREGLKDETGPTGNVTHVKIVKNKVAPPFKECDFDIMYGEGISQSGTLIDLGVSNGVVKKSGAWYYDWNGEKLGQGRPKAKLTLDGDPAMMSELYDRIIEKIDSPTPTETEDEANESND